MMNKMKLTELRNIIREIIAEQFATPEELKDAGLNPDTKNVKAGSIEKDTDLQGRKITRYIKVSKKGKETPMISYDDVGQSKLKKYPFIGADPYHEVKLFDRSSEAEKLYKSLQDNFVNKGELKDNEIEFLRALRLTAIANDQIFLLAQKAENDQTASKAMVKCCEDLKKYIHKTSEMEDPVRLHSYLDKQINIVKEVYKKKPREDKDNDCFDITDSGLEDRNKKINFKNFLGGTTQGFEKDVAPTYSEEYSNIKLVSLIEKNN